MAERRVQGIAIGTVITVLSFLGGGIAWYDGRQDVEHAAIAEEAAEITEFAASESYRKSVDLELRAINIELKILRTIEERRPLTADEQDRLEYLKELREILLEAQREQVQ